MSEPRPRPEGFDYNRPDPEPERCPRCNRDGMNRTGLMPVAYMGALTTSAWAIECPIRCVKGLRRPPCSTT